jgi:hypothetical protein
MERRPFNEGMAIGYHHRKFEGIGEIYISKARDRRASIAKTRR